MRRTMLGRAPALVLTLFAVAGCGHTKTVTHVTTAPAPNCTILVQRHNHYALVAIKLGIAEAKLLAYYTNGDPGLRPLQNAYHELERDWRDCQ